MMIIIVTGFRDTVDTLLIDRKVNLDCHGRPRIHDVNLSVFREKNKFPSIIIAIENYKELGQRQYNLQWFFPSCFIDHEEPWLLALEIKPRRPALQASTLYQSNLPRYALDYEILRRVFGSSFFTNLPAAKAMETPVKYTKVNNVEAMTFSAITSERRKNNINLHYKVKAWLSRQ